MLVLTVIKGPDRGKRFEIPDGEPQQIGRSSEALPLSDQTISRRHCELTPDEKHWFINDLESANGTFVNGVRIDESRQLSPGDQIRTGNTLFLVGRSTVGGPQPTPGSLGGSTAPPTKHGIRVAKPGELSVEVSAMVDTKDESMIMAIPNPDQAAPAHLRMVYAVLELVGTVFAQQELLERIMDVVFEHFSPDRGFILLGGKAGERPEPVVVRHSKESKPKEGEDPNITISRTIVQHVMKNDVGLLSSNAMADAKFKASDSVMKAGMRSTLCVPIKFKGKLYGVIHLDSQVANFTFTEDQLRALSAIGVATGLAMGNMEMLSEHLRRERLATIGQTVASLSHSIKNIIQGVRGGADVVELGIKKENLKVVKGGWDIVHRNLDRFFYLATNMLAFSKQHTPDFEETNLNRLIEECVELMAPAAERKEVPIIADLDDNTPALQLDPNGIHQVIVNLLSNALDAVEQSSGVITIKTRYNAPAETVAIEINDNGPGVPDEILDQLFQPFLSTKGMKGTGLGLAVSRKLVEEHAGTIEYRPHDADDPGATFVIILHAGQHAQLGVGDTQERSWSEESADQLRTRITTGDDET